MIYNEAYIAYLEEITEAQIDLYNAIDNAAILQESGASIAANISANLGNFNNKLINFKRSLDMGIQRAFASSTKRKRELDNLYKECSDKKRVKPANIYADSSFKNIYKDCENLVDVCQKLIKSTTGEDEYNRAKEDAKTSKKKITWSDLKFVKQKASPEDAYKYSKSQFAKIDKLAEKARSVIKNNITPVKESNYKDSGEFKRAVDARSWVLTAMYYVLRVVDKMTHETAVYAYDVISNKGSVRKGARIAKAAIIGTAIIGPGLGTVLGGLYGWKSYEGGD